MTLHPTVSKRMDSAKKRVAGLKDFHNHVFSYFVFNTLLYVIRGELLEVITHGGTPVPADFLEYLNLNFLLASVLWGIGLLVHGLYAYRCNLNFISKWEALQISKLMEERRQAPNQN